MGIDYRKTTAGSDAPCPAINQITAFGSIGLITVCESPTCVTDKPRQMLLFKSLYISIIRFYEGRVKANRFCRRLINMRIRSAMYKKRS